jgi:hypothetical protein
MTQLSDPERLIKVETNLSNLAETVKDGFAQNNEAMAKIDSKLDTTMATFVTKDEFKTYKTSQNVQKALLSVLMIIIGSLVGFFVANIGK